jgi:capsular polysaccharide biosynthesis protein
LQLKEILNIIRKRWWLALVVALAAMVVAFFYSVAQPKIYETSVIVLGKPAKPDENLNNTIKSEVRRLPTTLKSTDTAARIDQRGHFDLGPAAIAAKITALPKPDEFYLLITVDDTVPERAANIANAAADIIHDDNLLAVALAPDDSKIFFDKTAKAPVPDRPSTPRTNLNTAAAGALGLVVGLILIFVVDFFDTRIQTPEDLERLTGLNVLGTIPSWRPDSAAGPKVGFNRPNPLPVNRLDGGAGDAGRPGNNNDGANSTDNPVSKSAELKEPRNG